MHILVCMKAVPSTTQVSVDGQFRLCRDSVHLQWNVADESALEAGLRFRGSEGRVTVLAMGPTKLEDNLRELLIRGVDRAVLLSDPSLAGADTRATAAALAAAAEHLGPFDLILCGRRAIDGETGQVPGMLAGALSVPCVTNTDRLVFEAEKLQVHRSLETGAVCLEVSLPAVVSVCEYSYNLRMPSISSMRMARQKQVEQLSVRTLGLPLEQCGLKGSLTKVVAMSSHFPGLRKGPKEENPVVGASRLLQFCREVGK